MPPIRQNTVQQQYDTPTRAPNIAQRSRCIQLLPHECVRIVELKAVGWSYTEIYERYSYIPIGTMKTTIARFSKRGSIQETLVRSGQPRKLTEQDYIKLLQAIEENLCTIYYSLLNLVGFKYDRKTIQRFLQNENKRKWLLLKQPELKPEDIRKQLQWAQRIFHYTSEQWKKIFWSDETTVEHGKGGKHEWIFTRPKYQIAHRDIQEYSVYKGIKQIFWAAFSGSGRRTGLIPLFGNPDTPRGEIDRYIILELYQRILPTLMNGIDGAIFQQDNASVHTAYVICNWLAEQDFENMKWPPYSPDLNPIENLWALLKAKIYELHPELRGMPDNENTLEFLIETAQEAWSLIDTNILENLAVSMPHCVQQIINNDGWYTSY